MNTAEFVTRARKHYIGMLTAGVRLSEGEMRQYIASDIAAQGDLVDRVAASIALGHGRVWLRPDEVERLAGAAMLELALPEAAGAFSVMVEPAGAAGSTITLRIESSAIGRAVVLREPTEDERAKIDAWLEVLAKEGRSCLEFLGEPKPGSS